VAQGVVSRRARRAARRRGVGAVAVRDGDAGLAQGSPSRRPDRLHPAVAGLRFLGTPIAWAPPRADERRARGRHVRYRVPVSDVREVAVLGGGAWGTALAVHLARHSHARPRVALYIR